jgi:hypothetical protein
MIRWAAADVDRATAAITECDRLIAHYEQTAETVRFAPDAYDAMKGWAERHRQDKQYWEDELPKLRQRLADKGG